MFSILDFDEEIGKMRLVIITHIMAKIPLLCDSNALLGLLA